MSIDPSLGENHDAHSSPVAIVASLSITTLYFFSLFGELKTRRVVARKPTIRSFTGKRFLIFIRWSLAYSMIFFSEYYLLEGQFSCGILSLIACVGFVPPFDRLLFASVAEMSARIKSNAVFLKLFRNMGAFTIFFSFILYTQNNFKVTIEVLLISIGLLLIVPIVLLVKGGWKALSLRSGLPPAALQHLPVEVFQNRSTATQTLPIPIESVEAIVSTPDMLQATRISIKDLVNKSGETKTAPIPIEPVNVDLSRPSETKTIPVPAEQPPALPAPKPAVLPKHIPRKYYGARAWHWNWPVPKEAQRYPVKEEGFNLLIKGFETSWLIAKDYQQRLSIHRDPPAFLRDIIAEAEAYLQSMRLFHELDAHYKMTSVERGTIKFVPDEVSKIWKADRRLRSLYQASQCFADGALRRGIMIRPFRVIAPLIAEYRAMTNLVKHLKHSLSRIQGKKPPKATTPTTKTTAKPITKPMQTEVKVPVVFISYSWDSPQHEEWVINLATKLRENGVDAILDKWDLGFLGKLLPHFMETSISQSQRVICVMTPNYKKKTENLTGGVGYEYSIITAEIFTDSINTSKFIPLFRSGTDTDAIPIALKGRKYVDMRDDTQFDEKFIHELLRDIYEEPKFKKPAIGKKTKF